MLFNISLPPVALIRNYIRANSCEKIFHRQRFIDIKLLVNNNPFILRRRRVTESEIPYLRINKTVRYLHLSHSQRTRNVVSNKLNNCKYSPFNPVKLVSFKFNHYFAFL